MTAETLFEKFRQQKILVLGDVMIDAYLEGKVSRMSPEAPVPIVDFTSREERLGGAANVALNLLSLGAKVVMCSVIGEDSNGETMMQLLRKREISAEGMVQSKDRQTTVKTRVIGNHQQLLRVDQEQTNDISKTEEDKLLANIELLLKNGCDAVILEDYNKGVLTERVITETLRLANKFGVPTTVDPKLKNFFAYKGATLFKPNLKELQEGLSRYFPITNRELFEDAVNELCNRIQCNYLLVTLSEHGVFVKKDDQQHYIPAHVRNIADVSGAGDTVISVATLCLVAGLGADKIAEIANLAGGIVCEEPGVVAIRSEKLLSEIQKLKIEC
ncbi:MAG: D-glycero-beta-D-manno-heptose-7-phosphate kinase [Brumimicrobium sp.]|nr:D-glycero-beta-D-manno-heptose-7-phosphate kinase [Brumimicrobium sp.]